MTSLQKAFPTMTCVLCHSNQLGIQEDSANYFICRQCDLRFLAPSHRLSAREEKKHYENHNNDVSDPHYRNFVTPLYNEIMARVRPGSLGLDFGAGPGPVTAVMLEESGIAVDRFDPFFGSAVETLKKEYDFIYACESAEHFYNPGKEFPRLRRHLKEGGFLVLMTQMYADNISFKDWYYRRDPTHVCFYSKKTMDWLGQALAFRSVNIVSSRLVVFS